MDSPDPQTVAAMHAMIRAYGEGEGAGPGAPETLEPVTAPPASAPRGRRPLDVVDPSAPGADAAAGWSISGALAFASFIALWAMVNALGRFDRHTAASRLP